jgi:integrase
VCQESDTILATIRKRGERWQVQVRRAGNLPMSASFDTRMAAERWARMQEREADLARSGGHQVAVGTLANLLDSYNSEVGRLRPFGRSKQRSLDTLRRKLGTIKLRELTAGRIIAFAKERHKEGAGPVTIGIDLSYLGTVLRTMRAIRRLGVSDEPVREAMTALRLIGLIDKSKERDRRPTQDELDRLTAHYRLPGVTQLPMADLIEFAVATGMRREEITRLQWADLKAEARTITIRDRKHPRAKKGNDERVPLLAVTGYDALAIIQRQPRKAPWIFPVNADTISCIFPRACRALGIEDLHFHDLRHEATSRFFEAGLAVEQVALITGHKDWKTLRRYTQLRPEEIVIRFAGDAARPRSISGVQPEGTGSFDQA